MLLKVYKVLRTWKVLRFFNNHTEIAVTEQSHTKKCRISTANETFNTQILHIP